MDKLAKAVGVAVVLAILAQGDAAGMTERLYQMQHFGDITLRGLKVETGVEIKRLRDVLGSIREWELSSSLVFEDSNAKEAKKLLEEIKGSPGLTVSPVYSPHTLYWVRFDGGDTRMVLEDTKFKTLRVVRPRTGEKLPLQGFWVDREPLPSEDKIKASP